MKFLVFTRPIEGIEKKLPRPRELEAQIGWIHEHFTWAASLAPITAGTTPWR